MSVSAADTVSTATLKQTVGLLVLAVDVAFCQSTNATSASDDCTSLLDHSLSTIAIIISIITDPIVLFFAPFLSTIC